MNVKTLVQANANVIKITSLQKGNIVKIIEESSYSNPEVCYAVVTDLLNTGEKTFIEVLKYKKSYNDVDATVQLICGDKDIALFPASLDEVKDYFETALSSMEKSIEQDKKKLQEKIDGLNKAKQFSSGQLSQSLTEASFEEVTQGQFEENKRLKEEQLKALQAA